MRHTKYEMEDERTNIQTRKRINIALASSSELCLKFQVSSSKGALMCLVWLYSRPVSKQNRVNLDAPRNFEPWVEDKELPELVLPLSKFHTIPLGGAFDSSGFNVKQVKRWFFGGIGIPPEALQP
ncbi:hypothetical protein AVEN_60256-1 [Araneus ventricosus]|uniref:Uncharacterized protein n=1 Tax=Araneus ventricosus TaxID=182803 RepID=A0A4Y2D0V6_ARAVE|nr:hypothetical protein AVEN_60256-1 [Araneus ventricosus]